MALLQACAWLIRHEGFRAPNLLAIAVAALVFFAKKGKEEGPQTPEVPEAPAE